MYFQSHQHFGCLDFKINSISYMATYQHQWNILAFPEPPGSFILVDFMFFIMHTASITNFTPAGGLFIPLSSDISFFVSVSNAYTKPCAKFEAFVSNITNSNTINPTWHMHHQRFHACRIVGCFVPRQLFHGF